LYFEWDEEKAASNLAKHGVRFDYAMKVFDDPNRLERYQRRGGEDRWQVIGQIEGGVFTVITHDRQTIGGEEVTRIISARKATSHERQGYYKNLGWI
jgi:hypothetical protein